MLEMLIALSGRIKKQVYFISTIGDPSKSTTGKRKNKDGSTVEIFCPEAVSLYNQNMGGVDNADAKRKVYSCLRRGKKWWLRLSQCQHPSTKDSKLP
jgi:hypothetical protein